MSLHIDVQFTAKLQHVPATYLADHVLAAISSRFVLPGGYPWKDNFGEGVVRRAPLQRVLADIKDSSLLFGSKMARLLAGRTLSDSGYLLAVGAEPHEEDPRFVDDVDYASVLSWQSVAPASVEARARHVKSLLADIDRQLANAPMGIAHIGMDAERDAVTADLRRERNLETVREFGFESRVIEVHLHYYLPRSSEVASWMIDETVDSQAVIPSRILYDARLLGSGKPDFDSDEAAWHLPPPPVPPA